MSRNLPQSVSAGALDRPLVFVDLETTGATAISDWITEIGIIEVDGNEIREWSSLVNPQVRIPQFIERLTGISNAMVATAPTFEQLADEVYERLQGRLFVAHNARFDYGFLKHEFARVGIDFRAVVLCTVKLSRKLFPQYHKHSLDSLIERHGLAAGDRHRALADARLIHQFWRHLLHAFESAEVEAAVAALTARPSLPPHLDANLVDELPSGYGVYLFYGENDLPLYVGKSKNIRKRVLAHFAANAASAREIALSQQVRRVEWIVTDGNIGASLVEANLIKRLQPVHSPRPRCDADLCAWQLRQEDKDHWRPYLVTVGDVDFADADDLFGPFKNSREANRVLTALAGEHGLCHGLLGLEQGGFSRPCSAYQLRKCRGACIGKEPLSTHSARLMTALARWRIKRWPFEGPALLHEGTGAYVIDGWRYLGIAKSETEIWDLLESGRPIFDHDIYKILLKAERRFSPLRTNGGTATVVARSNPPRR